MSVFRVILVHIFPAFFRIRTEYGEILSVFISNAGKCGKNTDQNNSENGHFNAVFYATLIINILTNQINIKRKLKNIHDQQKKGLILGSPSAY